MSSELSHPFAKNKAKGWGTGLCIEDGTPRVLRDGLTGYSTGLAWPFESDWSMMDLILL